MSYTSTGGFNNSGGGGGGGGSVNSVTATAPIVAGGTATDPVISASYNAANAILKLDSGGLVPSAQLGFTAVNAAIAAANASINVNAQKITNLGTPTAATDAATKTYVDALVTGLLVKGPVRVATTAALPANTYSNGSSGVGATITITATGTLTIDGVVTALNDRVLVKDEATSANDGIYTVTTAGATGVQAVLTRATDMNTATAFPGAYVLVDQGTANKNRGFMLPIDPDVAFTIGTTGQTWLQFTGVGDLTAGNGISFSGNTISVATTLPDNYTLSAAGTALTVTNAVTISGTLTTSTITAAASTALALTGNAASTWSTSAGALTIDGFAGVNFKKNGTTYSDHGVTTASTITYGAGISLAGAAGAGALTFGSMTGDTTLPTGALTYAGASGKAGAIGTTAAALALSTTTSGTLSAISAGALTLTGNAASTWSVASANLTISTTTSGTLAVTSAGALTLTGAAASTWSTSSGALTITSAAACTWSTSSGALTIDSASGINIGTTSSTGLTLARAGQSTTVQGSFRAGQDFRRNGVNSPSSITGTQNNYAPAASQSSIIRQALSGAATITGLSISQNTGFFICIANIDTTNSITITNEDSGSTAGNRFTLPSAASIVITPGGSKEFWYDGTSSRWRPVDSI